jgi:GLPGLI family protein
MKGMKKIIGLFIIAILGILNVHAQTAASGEIVFEVKSNLKKSMGSSGWAEMMADKLPNFKTIFYKYSFADNKSLYQFDHWENKEALPGMFRESDEKTVCYVNHTEEKLVMQKDVFGTAFSLVDALPNIEWKISNENRIISGYNCRKAVGKILDSVYVFVFYTDEIAISGGPCSIHGLPGMILGMTIPRLYTSWIATSIKLTKPEPIVAPVVLKDVYTLKKAESIIVEKTKDWIDDPNDPESKKWLDQMIWNVIL